MRSTFLFLYLLVGVFSIAQPEIVHTQSVPFKEYIPIAVLNSGEEYVLNGSTLSFFSNKGELQFSNVSLGDITSVDTFNPLKLLLLYEDFNTVLLLDNRLTEIQKIDFNAITPYRTISLASTASRNSFWYYNLENQKVELFDYRTNSTLAQTLPLQSPPLALDSDYNYCYVLTQDFILWYNYQGSLLKKIPNKDYNQIVAYNENIYISNGHEIATISENGLVTLALKIKDLLIKRFYLTNETLYIYDGEKLHQFQIKSE